MSYIIARRERKLGKGMQETAIYLEKKTEVHDTRAVNLQACDGRHEMSHYFVTLTLSSTLNIGSRSSYYHACIRKADGTR